MPSKGCEHVGSRAHRPGAPPRYRGKGRVVAGIDPALIAAARDGDAAAMEALLRAAHPRIEAYARRYCIGQMAEDATQEALWTLHQKLPALRSVTAFPAWLIRIVARICFGLVSPLWRRIEALQKDRLQGGGAAEIELRIDLERAIESLPAASREAILLVYHCDLSVAEIAERTGTTATAARVRLHRARALLRRRLCQPSGEGLEDD